MQTVKIHVIDGGIQSFVAMINCNSLIIWSIDDIYSLFFHPSPVAQSVAMQAVNSGVVSLKASLANILSDVC